MLHKINDCQSKGKDAAMPVRLHLRIVQREQSKFALPAAGKRARMLGFYDENSPSSRSLTSFDMRRSSCRIMRSSSRERASPLSLLRLPKHIVLMSSEDEMPPQPRRLQDPSWEVGGGASFTASWRDLGRNSSPAGNVDEGERCVRGEVWQAQDGRS